MREIQSNTSEQMEHYLRTALEVLEQIDVPPLLEAIAFERLLDWAAAKQVLLEQRDMPAAPGAGRLLG